MRLDRLFLGWPGDLRDGGWIDRPRVGADRLQAVRQLPDRWRRRLAASRLPSSDREAFRIGSIVPRPLDWRRGRRASLSWGRERALVVQQTRAGRRLRQALLGSTLDPLEGAILRALVAGPEHAGKGGDLQVSFPLTDLVASLSDHFSGRAIDRAIGRLATAGLVLRLDEDLYVTTAGLGALGRAGRFRLFPIGRRKTLWVIPDPRALAEAHEVLARAKRQLTGLHALDPPPRARRSLDEALERIERLASTLR